MLKSLLIGPKDIQAYLVRHGRMIVVDGLIGKKTRTAIDAQLRAFALPMATWTVERRFVAIQQLVMQEAGASSGAIDGLIGPATRYAVEVWQNLARDDGGLPLDGRVARDWPPREADVREYYGAPGSHLKRLKLPYKMRLAWDMGQVVTSITLHEKVEGSAYDALSAVLKEYGIKRIREMGMDVFSGSYVNRSKRGGMSLSMHAYGIAIDFDDTHNQLRWSAARARFAQPEYAAWWNAWESEGWVSLGRERNYDWMHVQAARL